MGEVEIVRFMKDCTCPRVAATTNQTHIEQSQDCNTLIFTAVFIPGPSCDTCGKAWVRNRGLTCGCRHS